MRAEIILVGDELLEDMGGVQPQYMGELLEGIHQDLEGRGYSMGRLSVVGDAPGELAPLLEDAVRRGVDLVLTVGGLGPTHDDRVREEVARAVGAGPPERHPDAFRWLVETFRDRGIPLPEEGGSWERMGYVPRGVEPVHNTEGMAAGLAFQMGDGTQVRCLPGVTFEALPMWRRQVLPGLDPPDGSAPASTRSIIVVRGASEGVVGPLVEGYVAEHPEVRGRVNLMEPDGRSFRSIRVTLTAPHGSMARAVEDLVGALRSIEDVTVEVGEGRS